MENVEFQGLLTPYVHDLRRYCQTLARSKWDAEDLFQETLLRAYRALGNAPHRVLSKAYFRRMAYTAFIDAKRKCDLQPLPLLEDYVASSVDFTPLALREAFELLASQLSVRQMVYMLLVDIFGFTAKEAAELVHVSEGAVKEGVRRARKKLHRLSTQATDDQITVTSRNEKKPPHGSVQRTRESSMRSPDNQDIFEGFLQAIRVGDARLIYETYNTLSENGIHVVQVNTAAQVPYFLFRDLDGHQLSFFSKSHP